MRKQQQEMKILIRNQRTGFYLAKDDKWVKEIADARDFVRTTAAISYASAQQLAGIELVHAFPEKKYNFTLALRDFSWSGG